MHITKVLSADTASLVREKPGNRQGEAGETSGRSKVSFREKPGNHQGEARETSGRSLGKVIEKPRKVSSFFVAAMNLPYLYNSILKG